MQESELQQKTTDELRERDQFLLEWQNDALNAGNYGVADRILDERTEIAMLCNQRGASL